MKRRSQSTSNQPRLKKPGIPNSTDTLRSKIATKLQSLFDGFVSDLQNISKEKEPDLTVLFDTQHVSNFVNDSQNANHALSDSNNAFEDNSTLILQNFINSAKSRISGLLNKEQTFQETNNSLLETAHESYPQGSVKTVIADPLQIQISLKVQSLLCKALDNEKLVANGKSQNASSSGNVSESELQDLSRMLQDFMNLAKQKLSLSLSKGHSKHPSASVQSENGGSKPSSWKSQLCNVPQESPHSHKHCHTNRLLSAPCGLDSNAELLKHSAIQCKLNKLGKENLNFLSSGLRRTTPSIHSSKMYSPHLSDSDSFESSTLYIPKTNTSCNSYENGKGGMMFLEDSERAPEYLDLEINTDVEDQPASDSDEEVIVLGEKRPTYEEITLEEDDEEEIPENVEKIEKPEGNENEIEELLFNCPKCEKVFRVESLLKFHVRMHGVEDPPLASASEGSLEKPSPNGDDESSSTKSSKIYHGSTRKEKENKTKSKSKSSSHKQRLHREKRLKYDKKRNICKHS